MKRTLLAFIIFPLMLCCVSQKTFGQYYDFPYVGWNQSFTSGYWNGFAWVTGIGTVTITQDTVINGIKYFISGVNGSPMRNENGKIYRLGYWNPGGPTERLEYDFTLGVNDTFPPNIYIHNTLLKVITKEKITNFIGDSVWKMELINLDKDTFTWIEGIGDLRFGLITSVGFENSSTHMCTKDDKGRRLGDNYKADFAYDCDFIHGIDVDHDGYVVFDVKNTDIPFTFLPNELLTVYHVRSCDNIRIAANNVAIHTEPKCGGTLIEKSTSPFYISKDISTYPGLYLSINCKDFAVLRLYPCTKLDCNDNNTNINSGQIEILYNDLDDDCDSLTLDNDLDTDGHLYPEDCNDSDDSIYPGAIDLPANGIDEDCDGIDAIVNFITSNDIYDSIKVIPNPAMDNITLDIADILDEISHISITDSYGQELFNFNNTSSFISKTIDVSTFPKNMYFINIKLKNQHSINKKFVKL